ncbi:MAG: o-succinylbenzoate--CoA ligase [Ignavibacteriales bacterium]|nr:MAG: o-succinylbenzoate--CoA ligase [Ignavibacteriales bacterium]
MTFTFFNKEIDLPSHHPAFISNERTIYYDELDSIISGISSALLRHGVIESGKVAILAEPCIDYLLLLMATWKINAVPIPLNIRLSQNELKTLLKHSGTSHVLVDEKNDWLIEKNNTVKIINFPFDTMGTENTNESTLRYDKTALIMYTSGSTGLPKGVLHSFNNFINSALSSHSAFSFTQDDKWLLSLPVYHIGGLMILIRTLLFGSTLIIPSSLKTEDLAHSIKNFRPTLASLVSTSLLRLMETNVKPEEQLRYTFLGGGPSSKDLIFNANDAGWKIVKVYGSTETTSMITAFDTATYPDKIESSGKALLGNNIVIVDEQNKILPPGKIGEIAVTGKSIAKGFLYNDELSYSSFRDNYFLTGDFGYIDDDGFLFVESRNTDFIISGGENLNLKEVEKQILHHPMINEACTFGLPDNTWGMILAAAIVLKENIQLNEKDVTDYLRQHLASFKIPKKIIFLKYLPKTELGKIRVDELRNMFH